MVKLIQKHISITEEQERFIEENFINLTKFIRSKLKEKMDDEKNN